MVCVSRLLLLCDNIAQAYDEEQEENIETIELGDSSLIDIYIQLVQFNIHIYIVNINKQQYL